MDLAHGIGLVSLGCYDKYCSLSGLNNKQFFLTVPESGKSRFKVLAGSMWCLVRNFFLVCRQWPPCCCILTWWKEIISLTFLLPRALNPIYRGSTLMTYLPPKVSKCYHTGGSGFNIWMLGGHKYSVYSNLWGELQHSWSARWLLFSVGHWDLQPLNWET